MDNYAETSREEYTGENAAENNLEKVVPEIPVAPTQEGKTSLLPKKEGQEDELIITFRKPFDFEGETFRELDLHGLEDLRGRDLTAIEKAFNMSLKGVKFLKHIRFIFEQIDPTKLAEIINKTDIVLLPAYRDGSRTPNI